MRVKVEFHFGEQQGKRFCLFFFLLLWSCLYVHKILMWAFSLFSSTLRDTQYFSLANAHTHTHKHYISKHVCFCSGYNCCTPSLSSIVFLCVCVEQFFCFLMLKICMGLFFEIYLSNKLSVPYTYMYLYPLLRLHYSLYIYIYIYITLRSS